MSSRQLNANAEPRTRYGHDGPSGLRTDKKDPGIGGLRGRGPSTNQLRALGSYTATTLLCVGFSADTRYKHVELPVVLNRRDVKFVEKLELDQGKSFYLVAPIGLAVLLIIGLATSPIHID